MANVEKIISSFAKEVGGGKIEIYNEFSLQHELGFYLRDAFPKLKVQFERNVLFFGLERADYIKREIDISIFDEAKPQPLVAIELKYPRNGQYPEQMFSFCKDISFAEQLKASWFRSAYLVIFAKDRLFYEGEQQGICAFFRGGKKLSGVVQKPTGERNTSVSINGSYSIRWRQVKKTMKYCVIKAQ